MIPHDVDPSRLALPEGERNAAVLITSSDSARYQRLAGRLQQQFPGMLIASRFRFEARDFFDLGVEVRAVTATPPDVDFKD